MFANFRLVTNRKRQETHSSYLARSTTAHPHSMFQATAKAFLENFLKMTGVRVDDANTAKQEISAEGDEMTTTAATVSGADASTSAASPDPKMDPPLMRIPGELRNKIYAFATSCSSPFIVGLPLRAKNSWQLPVVATVSKQIRQEVVSIFFECNTLRIHSLRRATLWYPFRSPTHMQTITALFLEIGSSRNWYLTLKAFNIQPTVIRKEANGAMNLLVEKDELSGLPIIVEEQDFDVVVKWEPFERAIESLAKHPRPNLFLTQDQLEEAWVEENQRQAEISRRRVEAS